MAVTIRTLEAEDWPTLRDLRLVALEQEPEAFAETLDEARQRSDDQWRALVKHNVVTPTETSFLALEDDVPCGLAYARVLAEDARCVQIGAMWVDRARRGRNIGRQLLETALAWARQQQATHAQLWVGESNTAAIRFYRAAGFCPTDERRPYIEGSTTIIVLMRCELTD